MKISGQEVSFSKILLSILHIVGWTLKPGCGDTAGLISLDFRAVDPDNDNLSCGFNLLVNSKLVHKNFDWIKKWFFMKNNYKSLQTLNSKNCVKFFGLNKLFTRKFVSFSSNEWEIFTSTSPEFLRNTWGFLSAT